MGIPPPHVFKCQKCYAFIIGAPDVSQRGQEALLHTLREAVRLQDIAGPTPALA